MQSNHGTLCILQYNVRIWSDVTHVSSFCTLQYKKRKHNIGTGRSYTVQIRCSRVSHTLFETHMAVKYLKYFMCHFDNGHNWIKPFVVHIGFNKIATCSNNDSLQNFQPCIISYMQKIMISSFISSKYTNK